MGRFDRLTRGLRHLLLLSLLFSQALIAAPPPPTAVTGRDHGWDKGTAVDLSWEYEDPSKIEGGFFSILYSMKEEGPFIPAGETEGPVMEYAVTGLTPGQEYYFQVKAVDANQEESAPVTTEAITPRLQWFDGSRIWFLITVLIFCGSVVYFIEHARKGRPLKVRKIAG
jgi:hypothetical protein